MSEYLVRLKIAVENGVPAPGETLPARDADRQPLPRVLVSRYAGGALELVLTREDLPADVVARLRAIDPARLLAGDDEADALLAATGEPVRRNPVRWYTVERAPAPAEFPDVTRRDGRFVIVRDGVAVAQAWSACVHPEGEEVTVFTMEGWRGRGFARQVAAAWAADVLARGVVGFYAHVRSNHASEALARSLGVSWLSDELEYE